MKLKKDRYTLFKGVKSMKDDKNENLIDEENVTKYGEFISSYFAWRTLDKQKEIADKLANITDENKE